MGAHLQPNSIEMLPLKMFLLNFEAHFRCKKNNHIGQPLYEVIRHEMASLKCVYVIMTIIIQIHGSLLHVCINFAFLLLELNDEKGKMRISLVFTV